MRSASKDLNIGFPGPPLELIFLKNHSIFEKERNYPWKIECFLEDLFLGGQSSIILGYRRLSVKSLLVQGLGSKGTVSFQALNGRKRFCNREPGEPRIQ
jgi:hypothetical protein